MLRYIVERIADGEFLELELPIVVSSAGTALGGPGKFQGEIVPVVQAYKYAGTDALIDAYATYIHEEDDGVIRGTWLVTHSTFEGASWKIEGQGFSAFFKGRPFEDEYRGVQVDPIAVARHVATHAQDYARGDAGITVVGSSSVRKGTDSDLKADAAKAVMDAAKSAWDAKAKPRKALQDKIKKLSVPHDKVIKALDKQRKALTDVYEAKVKAKAPSGEIAAAKAAVTAKTAQLTAARAAKNDELDPLREDLDELREAEAPLKVTYDAKKELYDEAKQKAADDGGAYKLLWWDTPDCLDSMTDAIEAAGYEWVEWSGWNSAKTKILKEIRCVARVGRKQDSLAFVEGDNILETVVVEADSSEYANVVVAIGAGEGRDALRVRVGSADSRRRKIFVLDAKQVTKKDTLTKRATAELKRRLLRLRIEGIRVIDHPNARLGTFQVGDTILLDVEVGWLGRQRLWRRVEEIERDSEGIADVMLGDPK